MAGGVWEKEAGAPGLPGWPCLGTHLVHLNSSSPSSPCQLQSSSPGSFPDHTPCSVQSANLCF